MKLTTSDDAAFSTSVCSDFDDMPLSSVMKSKQTQIIQHMCRPIRDCSHIFVCLNLSLMLRCTHHPQDMAAGRDLANILRFSHVFYPIKTKVNASKILIGTKPG